MPPTVLDSSVTTEFVCRSGCDAMVAEIAGMAAMNLFVVNVSPREPTCSFMLVIACLLAKIYFPSCIKSLLE